MTALDRFLGALRDRDCRPRQGSGGNWSARCPAHEDRSPSLSLRQIEGQALVYCHAGCVTRDVLAALGLGMADLYDERRGAAYRYDDGRVVHRSPDKGFTQSGKTKGSTSLYRLGKVTAAVAAGRTVYVVEGEKDVHALESVGLVATTSPMGAGKWSKVDPSPLAGATVVVVADNDEPGRKHAGEVKASLDELRATVTVVTAKAGKDAADHIAAGLGPEDFIPVTDAPATPAATRRLRSYSLSEVKITPTRYMWTGYLPLNELAMLVGKPGIGKSTLMVDLAAKVTTGGLDGDLHGQPRPVLYSLTEDAPSVFKARFLAAGGNPELLHMVDAVQGGADGTPLLVAEDVTELRTTITRLRPALVVLDALNSCLIGQTNDNANVRPQLELLKALAHTAETTVVGIGHFRKSTAGIEPLDAIGGAGAYGQVIRQALGCARDEDEGTCTLSVIKSNGSSLDVASLAYRIEEAAVGADDGGTANVGRVAWLGESPTSVRDLLQRTPQAEEERSERDEAADFIRGYLLDHGCSASAETSSPRAAPPGSTTTCSRRPDPAPAPEPSATGSARPASGSGP